MEQLAFHSPASLHSVLSRPDFISNLNEVAKHTFKKNREAAFVVYGGKGYYMVSEVTRSKRNASTIIPIHINTARDRGLAMLVHSHPMRTNEWVKHNLPAIERTVPSAQDIKTAENLSVDYPGVLQMIVTPSDTWDKDGIINIFMYRRLFNSMPNAHHNYIYNDGDKGLSKAALTNILDNSGFGHVETTTNQYGHYEIDLTAKLARLFSDRVPK